MPSACPSREQILRNLGNHKGKGYPFLLPAKAQRLQDVRQIEEF